MSALDGNGNNALWRTRVYAAISAMGWEIVSKLKKSDFVASPVILVDFIRKRVLMLPMTNYYSRIILAL